MEVGQASNRGVRRGIAVYYPGGKVMKDQMTGLWYSWKVSTADSVPIDLIIFHAPSAEVPEKMKCLPVSHRVPDKPNCVCVPHNVQVRQQRSQQYCYMC